MHISKDEDLCGNSLAADNAVAGLLSQLKLSFKESLGPSATFEIELLQAHALL